MPAVRVRDALRYASKFVGLVLAVTVVAGGFIAGGAYLAADAIDLSDPSLSALSDTPVFIGVVLFAIGVVLALIGLIALAYKFLTDGIATAMEARDLGEATGVVDDVADESAEEASDGAADDPGRTSADADRWQGADGRPAESPDDHGGGDVERSGQTPPTSEPADGPVGAPTDETSTADLPENDRPGREPVEDPDTRDASDDRSRTGDTRNPDRVDEQPGPGAESSDGGPEDPPEWTPPDPAEFESGSGEGTADDGAAGDRADEQWSDETATNETMAEDGEDGPFGSADGQSDGESAESEESTADAELDDDATLADEGVESFSAASEDDPLSDRLPGDDES